MSYSKLGLLLGDPSGIGFELCAKLLEERSGRESNRVVLIGEPSLFDNGRRWPESSLKHRLSKISVKFPMEASACFRAPNCRWTGSVLERQVKPAAVMHSILSAGLRHSVNEASWTVFVSHR